MRYILLVLLLFGFANAGEHFYSKDFSYLKLESHQYERMKEIFKEYRIDVQEFRVKKKRLIASKQELFLRDDFDANSLMQINKELNSITTQIEIKLFSALHDTLTPKQKKKFVDYIDEWEIE